MNEAETSQKYVAMFAEHQKKQQRLVVATAILAALVSNPDVHKTRLQMVEEALGCADLLLEEACQECGSHNP